MTYPEEVAPYSPDDPLFPATAPTARSGQGFTARGFTRAHRKTAEPVRGIVNAAFVAAGLPTHGPHAFRLQHNRDTANARDFLVWGTWLEPVQGTGSDKPHSVASGSMPYKGTPADTLATAVYFGDDDAHIYVNGSYVDDVDVRLDANFADRTISGLIGTGLAGGATRQGAAALNGLTTGPAGSQFRYITLGATDIGARMNGKVTIVGTGISDNDGERLAPSSGTWTAGLYGPGGPATQPTGITGEFSVTRPAAAKTQETAGTPHDRVTKLSVIGAFGAECTTGC